MTVGKMRRAHIVTLICLLISFSLAGLFAMNYKGGSLATGTAVGSTASTIEIQKAELSPEAVEKANLIGMGVILGAVVFVTALAFLRKPAPSDEFTQK
ncbi:TPA: hypothetical protein H1005_00600 [archaeon]|uniref:Uncharacterized protein n=1 Tax=Candidatus Naiadarchaeum limnaeum TaxID=2756139 RepID=A0A832V2K7_9ARCH|nr:hypothetical protein [Candidatus Naiadarchaeales archaeon SRR2090153.bin1042]HIK00836.1 hypothetical protein [Candidatus Naiadarchaeum limnaeum]